MMDWMRALTLLVIGAAGASLGAQTEPATAGITQPGSGLVVGVGAPVSFQGATDRGTSPAWIFGDGATASGLTASHGFASPGTYTVTFKVASTVRVCILEDRDGNCTKWSSGNVTTSASVNVTVVGPPAISSFTATPSTPRVGEGVTLSWATSNASTVTLTGVGTVGGSGSMVVYPSASTNYTLTATNVGGSVPSSVPVTVQSVGVGTPSPANGSVFAGGSLSFSASVSGAMNTAVNWSVSGGGSINSSGLFTATTPGTYTVTATSQADGGKSGSTSVTVNGLGASLAGETTIPYGGSATLTPSFGAGTGVLNPGNRPVTSGAGVSVGPLTASQTYTLTVTNGGYSTPASATVWVTPAGVSTPSPSNASVNAGSSLQFSASVSGAVNTGVNWSVSGGGSIDASGLFSATTAGAYTVTATSQADSSKAASTPVTVRSVVSGVSLSPTSASLRAGEGLTFTGSASGLGGPNTAVTWSTNGGTIDSNGVYTAPVTGGIYSITATSVQDPNKSASAPVTVSSVSLSGPSPADPTVNAGSTLQFSASASGAVNTGLIWSVTGGGSISASGLFSATTAGTYTVKATSAANGSVSASTSVTVKSIVTAISVNPASATVTAGTTQPFAATVNVLGGGSSAVTWSATLGSIASNGVYTAPSSGGTAPVITATSVLDPTKTATATVTVPAVGMSGPSPASPAVNAGSTVQFSASATSAANTAVTWSTSGGGTISASGLYTATTAGIFTVTATSVSDSSKTASTNVTVRAVVTGVAVSPATPSLKAGEVLKFTATVSGQGGPSQAVSWTATGGSVAADGTWTAPITGGSYTLTATSSADPAKSGSATVTVSSASVSPISSATNTVNAGSTLQFSASVSGAANAGLTWSVSGGGSINGSGLFTATTAGVYGVTAKSVADPSKSALTTVTVRAVVSGITITPGTASLNLGESLKFTASVSGQGIVNHGVAWTATGGSIAPDGTFTPSASGDVTLTATSLEDSTVSRTAAVHVKGWVLNWKKDVIYVGTKEIAEVSSDGKTSITLVDHLGSPRFQWAGGSEPVIEQKFMPFGESLSDPASAAKFAKGFTNHEQTDPSGLIYMQARFYAPWFGQFLSPDPARDQHFEQTQSWNIYSYVMNQPTMKIDPTGMFADGPGFLGQLWQATVDTFTTHNPLYQGVAHVQDTIVAGSNAVFGTNLPMVSNLGKNVEANPGMPTSTALVQGLKPVQDLMTIAVVGKGTEKLVGAAGNLISRFAKGEASAVEGLVKAGEASDRGGLTKAGRALQKHGNREGSVFPRATGNSESINGQAKGVLEGILKDPKAVRTNLSRGGMEIRATNGQGVRYNADGSFSGFLDPKKK